MRGPEPGIALLPQGAPAGFEVALEALQIGAQFGGGLAAQIGVLFERFVENVFEGQRQPRD